MKRQPGCPYVCFRLDGRGHAVKIEGFRKAWQSACIRVGLGKIVPEVAPNTSETIYARARVDRPRSNPKAKPVYDGLIFHDLRRSAAGNVVRPDVPERVARSWDTRREACSTVITSCPRMTLGMLAGNSQPSARTGTKRAQCCTKMQQRVPQLIDFVST